MSSVFQRVLRVFVRAAGQAAAEALSSRISASTSGNRNNDDARPKPGAAISQDQKSSDKKHSGAGSSAKGNSLRQGNKNSSTATSGHPGEAPAGHGGGQAGQAATVFDVASRGLPPFSYTPSPDGQADPGEVVWTWVPYEEDASQGKDRPVLVLARVEGQLVVAQMTSKDHDLDAAQEARWGRYWHDVGSGPWDPRGRPSEVRLDRLLSVNPSAVRREGATMPRGTFDGVLSALRAHHS